MDGDKRRKEIMELLNTEKDPLSGTSLAKRLGVSRQVIVQDIALLRATNKNILSTKYCAHSLANTPHPPAPSEMAIMSSLTRQ